MTHPDWLLLASATAVRQPWKNGGGMTRQIAIWPPDSAPDACTWRVSAADVDHSGDFSDWSGYDRHLTVTHGAGIRLVDKDDGKALVLQTDAVFAFPGERQYACTLLDGPVRDCNVMVRRGWGSARMEVLHGSTPFVMERGFHLLYCIGGSAVVRGAPMGNEVRLGELDAIQFAERTQAEAAVIQITGADPSAACVGIHIRPHTKE